MTEKWKQRLRCNDVAHAILSFPMFELRLSHQYLSRQAPTVKHRTKSPQTFQHGRIPSQHVWYVPCNERACGTLYSARLVHASNNGALSLILIISADPQTSSEQRLNSQSQRPPPRSARGANTETSIARIATSGLDTPHSLTQTNNQRPLTMERSATNGTAGTSDVQRLEKKQQQLVDVENEYFRLNPWYNQQKEKPVFGLGQPLPHTMRRGMWWGKSDLKQRMEELQAEEEDLQKGIDARDGLDMGKEKGTHAHDTHSNQPLLIDETEPEGESDGSQTPLRRGQSSQQPHSADIQSYNQGRMPNVRRPTSDAYSMAGKQRNDNSTTESAPVNKHGLDEADQGNNGRNNFGLQDGLHPLQELDKSETTQTQKDQKEAQKKEHEEQQEYYNQYRNPIARLRAQYPQAPAEFLAVRLPTPSHST